jgi:YVTN family beta-propeller protein
VKTVLTRRLFHGLSFVSIFLLAMPVTAATARIWVLNNNAGPQHTIQIIDPATNKIVQTINGIGFPHGVAFSPDGRLAYVSSEDQSVRDNIYIVDVKTGDILKKAPLSANGYEGIRGRRGNLAAITKDGKRLLVCVGQPRLPSGFVARKKGAGGLDIVDASTLKVLKVFPTAGHDCYTTPDGKYWFAGTGLALRNLMVFDVKTEQILWKLSYKQGVGPTEVVTKPDGSVRWLIATPLADNFRRQISIVDFATHKELKRITLPSKPGPFKIAKAAGLERRDQYAVHGLAISPDGKILAVACRDANSVFFYTLPDFELLGHFSTATVPGAPAGYNGGDPSWLTFAHNGRLYIANSAADVVQVVDVKTMKEVARIPVGRQPDHVFVGP